MKKNPSNSIIVGSLVFCILLAQAALGVETSKDMAAEIGSAAVFYQNLMWIGQTPPAEAENRILAADVEKMKHSALQQNIPALENFVSTHSNSPWVPSIRANLGRYYYEHGLYTRALQAWELAWKATGDATQGPAKQVADFTFAYWTRLLASLGRKDTLRDLYRQTAGRNFDGGSLQQIVYGSKEGYMLMNSDPGQCYKCGTFALNSVGRQLKGASFDTRGITSIPSPETGFSMTKLVEFSREFNLDLVAVRWNTNRELVLPSVVHWKENHYVAVLKEKNGRYEVMDPTFGKPRWLTGEEIREEASGEFLVPGDRVPRGWTRLASDVTDTIHGQGFVSITCDACDSCGNGSGGGSN